MYKIDFHTHSILSHDGGITSDDYAQILQKGILDGVAITDHHTIEYALFCQKKLGEKIIVGEEMTTEQGHVIGLFLTKIIPGKLSIQETIVHIHEQGGLAYVPHAFDKVRRGIGLEVLESQRKDIDIIEGFNGRIIIRKQNTLAQQFAQKYHVPMATGSDSHVRGGLGSSYTMLEKRVERDTVLSVLSSATYHFGYQKIQYYFAPKFNEFKKIFI